jgi:zinc transporter ZupT
VRKWSDEWLHHFISFGAGIFLGAVFFELLPEAMAVEHRELVGIAILAGYLLIFFVEKFLFSRGETSYDHSHRVISIAAFIGLSVHSLIDGLGLSIMSKDPILGRAVFYSILAHHLPAAFSVGSLLSLGRMKKSTVVSLLALFAAMPPLGALLFAPLVESSSEQVYSLIVGSMTGTFLYVATGDLLPEVFHTKKNRWQNLGLLITGILLMAVIGFGFEHAH